MPHSLPLRARAVPSSDRAFERVVQALAAQVSSAEELELRLRSLYPHVALSERLLSGEPRVVYVYRDREFAVDSDESWWREPDVAKVTIEIESGLIREANDRWAGLMGASGETLRNRPYTDFLDPAAMPAAEAIIAAIRDHGEARSRLVMRRADGRPIPIEFHAVREGELIRVAYRPTEPGATE